MAVVLYGLSALYSIFLFRKGFKKDDWISYLLLLAAAVPHTAAVLKRGFSLERCPIHNLYEATTFVLWVIVAAYLLLGLWSRLRSLGAFASPILFGSGVFALMPRLDPAHSGQPVFTGGWTSLHAALTLLSYGAFGLSSIAALMYLNQAHDLKFHKFRAVLAFMPPIQRLEVIIKRLLLGGFVLLTAGILVGWGWLELPSGMSYWDDPKVLWSLGVWLLYLGLLVSHGRFAQRGRRFAWGAVGGFAFVLLTFWGTNLLSNIHNPPAEGSRERPPPAVEQAP
jgi:ABC-type uncharacterized transport system permease subunit